MPTNIQKARYLRWKQLSQELSELAAGGQKYLPQAEWIDSPKYTREYAYKLQQVSKLLPEIRRIPLRDRMKIDGQLANPNHVYLVTFTVNPNLKHIKSKTLEQLITYGDTAVRGLAKLKEITKCEIVNFVYALEHTKRGQPHWHLALETRKPCPKSNFRDMVRKLGKVDYDKSVSNDILNCLTYIRKENEPQVIISTSRVHGYLTQNAPSQESGNPQDS